MSFQNNLYSGPTTLDIDDFGIISLMYHRFEENKYPSTNIKLKDFKEHLNIIRENNIRFVNPNNFEQNLKDNKNQRKVLLTIDDGFSSFYENAWPILKQKGEGGWAEVGTVRKGETSTFQWASDRTST